MTLRKIRGYFLIIIFLLTSLLTFGATTQKYYVKDGDTATSISQKLGISMNVLEYNNNFIISSPLTVGEPLEIYSQNAILYTVIKGDTIYSLASTFFTTASVLMNENHLKSHKIHVGQKLLIPIVGSNADAAVGGLLSVSNTVSSSLYTVKQGDSLYSIAKEFDTTPSSLKALNNLRNSHLRVGQQLKISNIGQGGYGIVNPPKSYPFGYETFWPVPFEGVTSPFGMRYHPILHRKILHTGVDLRCDGAVVSAFAPGTVIYAGVLSGYGNIVIIDHGNGYQTRYAHLESMSVDEGDSVTEGEQIGVSGESGNVTGPHLHFEIRKNNVPVNPMTFFNTSQVTDISKN